MKVLLLNILADDLATIEKLDKEVHGGPYSELFRKVMGLKEDEFIPVIAALEKLPDPAAFDGIVMGGSIYNPIVGEEKPWMEEVYDFIHETTLRRIPLLGVCGGHQFIARALGQEIIYNPKGREFGTKEIWLTEEGKHDMLFHGLPERFKVQLSHQCIVKDLYTNWRLLASSDICDIQALAPNFYTRTVQFHLELGASHMKKIALMRRIVGCKIEETPCRTMILQNFVKYFIRPLVKNSKKRNIF